MQLLICQIIGGVLVLKLYFTEHSMFWLFSAKLIQLSESQFLHQNASKLANKYQTHPNYYIRYTFLANFNIFKRFYGLCLWGSDPLIDSFY